MEDLYPIEYIETVHRRKHPAQGKMLDDVCAPLHRYNIENRILKFIKKNNPSIRNLIYEFQMYYYGETERMLSAQYLKDIIDGLNLIK